MKKLDILKSRWPIGAEIGLLTIINYEKYGKSPYFWMVLCRCQCGQEILERPHRLFKRKIKSCGCTRHSYENEKFKKTYPIGTVFNQLTVIGHEIVKLTERTRNGHVYERRLMCLCACGKLTSVRASSAKCPLVESCGCIRRKKLIEAVRKRCQLPLGVAAMHAAFRSVKFFASARRLSWKLSLDQFHEICQKDCYYCGSKPSKTIIRTRSSGPYTYNGIDRKDSSVGYTKDNCVPCCKTCNYAKRTMTIDQFKDWLHRVAFHFLGLVNYSPIITSPKRHSEP